MRVSGRLLAIIFIIIILIAIPLTIYLLRGNLDFRKGASSAGASFSLDPTSGTIVKGGEVEVKILLNTAGSDITGADAVITFDRNILTAIDLDPDKSGVQAQAGNFFEKPLVLANKVDGNRIYLSINSFTPYKGAAVFGIIKFAAKKTGKVELKFVDNETKIAQQGTAANILQNANGSQFTVESSTGGTDTESSASASLNSNLDIDLNGDGKVNELDLQIFSQKLGATTAITEVDFNQDGKVDNDDFKIFEKAYKERAKENLTR